MILSKLPKDPKKAADAARSPDATIEDLECLATSEFFFVRQYVACNHNVNSTILKNLVPKNLGGGKEYLLALEIAENAKSLPNTLEKIFDLLDLSQLDGSRRENMYYERLTAAILIHENCPRSIAMKLLKELQLSRRIRLEAARYSKSQDVLAILENDRSLKVSNAASTRIEELKTNDRTASN